MHDETPGSVLLPDREAGHEGAGTSENDCPRCHKPLIDPGGLGWCKACGYCRSLEAEKSNQLLASAARGPSQAAALAGAARQIPAWFWVLLLGSGAVVGLSLAADRLLPPATNLPRALWTTIQMAAGLAIMFIGQLVAVLIIAPEDERLSFKDAIVPTRLLGLVVKRLPRMAPCLWTTTWGALLFVCAPLLIGGFNHWFSYLPKTKGPAQVRTS